MGMIHSSARPASSSAAGGNARLACASLPEPGRYRSCASASLSSLSRGRGLARGVDPDGWVCRAFELAESVECDERADGDSKEAPLPLPRPRLSPRSEPVLSPMPSERLSSSGRPLFLRRAPLSASGTLGRVAAEVDGDAFSCLILRDRDSGAADALRFFPFPWLASLL